MQKKIEFRTKVLFQILSLFIFLVIINFISSKYFIRLDLTEDKSFTISKVTKKVLSELDDYVNIDLYFSEKLPAELLTLKQEVIDILKEYQAYSKDKIKVRVIDPAKDPQLKNKVLSMGIPEVQMNIIEKDERQLIQGFLGLGIFYEDKKSIIPVIEETRNLEYELTTGIKRVITEELKTIGFLTGHQEKDIYSNYETLRKELEKNFKIEYVNLEKGKKQIQNNIALLIIAGPKEKISEREKFEIDQYIMNGGKVFFLIDKVDISEQLFANDLDVNLDDLIKNYGIQMNKNLVLDRICENAGFRTGYVQFITPYPYFVKIVKVPGYNGFNALQPITSKLETMTFFWASSIDTILTPSVNFIPLIFSSPQSWTTSGYYNLNPQQIPAAMSGFKSNLMAVISEGKFRSFYSDKQIPKLDLSDTELAGWTDVRTEETKKTECNDTNYLLFIADSDFLDENNIKRVPSNLTFILNAADWFALDKELITIRSRGLINREIKRMEENEKTIIKVLNIILVPIIVVVIGLVRFIIKKRRRKAYLGN
ncbi:MAG TPA: GldG family protein [bacterium]|nr:GldG family protein [bacterium]HPQ19235.1 GldG family protein [bacterium]